MRTIAMRLSLGRARLSLVTVLGLLALALVVLTGPCRVRAPMRDSPQPAFQPFGGLSTA
jgi:hypothetical protein